MKGLADAVVDAAKRRGEIVETVLELSEAVEKATSAHRREIDILHGQVQDIYRTIAKLCGAIVLGGVCCLFAIISY